MIIETYFWTLYPKFYVASTDQSYSRPVHFEPIFGPQYWPGSYDLNNLESTIDDDACILILYK